MKKLLMLNNAPYSGILKTWRLSRVDSNILYRVLADIDTEYGKIAKMTITQGKIHNYLGIIIDYSSP